MNTIKHLPVVGKSETVNYDVISSEEYDEGVFANFRIIAELSCYSGEQQTRHYPGYPPYVYIIELYVSIIDNIAEIKFTPYADIYHKINTMNGIELLEYLSECEEYDEEKDFYKHEE